MHRFLTPIRASERRHMDAKQENTAPTAARSPVSLRDCCNKRQVSTSRMQSPASFSLKKKKSCGRYFDEGLNTLLQQGRHTQWNYNLWELNSPQKMVEAKLVRLSANILFTYSIQFLPSGMGNCLPTPFIYYHTFQTNPQEALLVTNYNRKPALYVNPQSRRWQF